MNHESAFELLPDFALYLLETEEAGQVGGHVEGCAECRAELAALAQAGEALAFGTESMPMPAGAEVRIADGVRARLADLPGEQVERRPLRVVASGPERAKGKATPWRSIALASAAAVLLLAVGLTGTVLAWLDARDDAERLEGQLAQRAIELPLSGAGAAGTIYVSADFRSGVARFSGLEPAPAQHHYQVWSEGPGGARSAADFQGAAGDLVVTLPELPREMTRMFVTIEPDGAAGGVPTGPEVLSTPR